MRLYILTLFIGSSVVLQSCGAASKVDQAAENAVSSATPASKAQTQAPASSVASTYGSMLVESQTDLPTCNLERKGALAYVKAGESFYVCQDGWEKVALKGEKGDKGDKGEAVSNAQTVARIQMMNPSSLNFCNGSSSIEFCKFNGGQILTYADGTVQITANWKYTYYSSASTDSDFDTITKSFTMPSTWTGGLMVLDNSVRRGSDYNAVYLAYGKKSGQVSLYYDDNDNYDFDVTDTLLLDVVVEDAEK
jgi:hypothetical protein